MVQLTPAASVERQVVDGSMAKSAGSNNGRMSEIISSEPPVFESCVLSVDNPPTVVAGKMSVVGLRTATGGGRPTPMPLSCATSGELGSLLAKLIAPVSGPGTCGLKLTATVQDAPTARMAP